MAVGQVRSREMPKNMDIPLETSGGWCDDEMKMVRHHDKLMEQEAAFLAILLQNINEQTSHLLRLQDGLPAIRDRGDEKCSNFLWSKFHRRPGLKQAAEKRRFL